MSPITPKNVISIIEKVQRRSYLANPFYLILNCQYEEVDADILIYVDKNRLIFPSLKSENMTDKQIWCFKEDVDKLKSDGLEIKEIMPHANEYFYRTQDWIDLAGHRFKKIRKEIKHFINNFDFEVKESYPVGLTKKFVNHWFSVTRPKKSGEALITLEDEYRKSLASIDLLNQIKTAKGIYLLVDKKLVGFAIYSSLYPDFWVMVIQKIDQAFEGLSQFLYHQKARQMASHQIFSNGDDAMDPALADYKSKLRPFDVKQHFLVTTGTLQK